MIRFDALQTIAAHLTEELVVCNLGFPAQELFAIRDDRRIFYMEGSMGLAPSIAMGLALATRKTVLALDGDGSLLMNLGALATAARQNPANLKWIVIDNGSYGSTGDQPTATRSATSLAAMARGAGIGAVAEADSVEVLAEWLGCHLPAAGLSLLIMRVEPGNRSPGPLPLGPHEMCDRFRRAARD